MSAHKLLTIVVESAIERMLVQDLQEAGISGLTTVNARGFGERGQRQGDWEQSRSVRIETICPAETADELAERVLERWGKNYAVVVWLHDVEVIRSRKFDASEGGDS